MDIVCRDQAAQGGLKRYFTGLPCLRGHVSERFTRNKTCVACHKEKAQPGNKDRMATRRLRAPEEFRAKARERRARDPTTFTLRCQEWRAANPSYHRDRNRKLYEADPEKERRRSRDYAKANPAVAAARGARRRARKLAAEGTYSAKDVAALLIRQSHQCVCGAPLTDRRSYHVDHVIPLSRGGSNWPENLQLLCPPCNHRKGAKTMGEWDRKLDQEAGRCRPLPTRK